MPNVKRVPVLFFILRYHWGLTNDSLVKTCQDEFEYRTYDALCMILDFI